MYKIIFSVLAGLAIGSSVTYFLLNKGSLEGAGDTSSSAKMNSKPASVKYPLKATLYRFTINDGTQRKFNEWMKWHYDEYPAIINTLEREKMYSEAIFTDSVHQPGILYWLTIDAQGGAPVNNSPLKIDSVHNQYMKEVIKKGSRLTLKTEYYLIPQFLQHSIAEHQMNEK